MYCIYNTDSDIVKSTLIEQLQAVDKFTLITAISVIYCKFCMQKLYENFLHENFAKIDIL